MKHGSDASAGDGLARITAEDAGCAGGWGDESQQELDCGGFAGAVGAEEGYDFAGAQGEAEAVEGEGVAVSLVTPVRVAMGCLGAMWGPLMGGISVS